jgi:hypothetical protein
MARKTGTVTLEMIKKSGADINPTGIYYDSTKDRAFVKDPDGKAVYISASKVGGHREMFYAAAGLRNYISKHGIRPDKAARKQIVTRALNAEKAKAIWKDRYKKKQEASKRRQNPFRKKSPELKSSTDSIVIEVPKLSDIGEETKMHSKRGPEKFETTLKKAISKGIVTTRSAALKKRKGKHSAEEEIKKLGLDIDPRYLTFYNTKKGPKVMVRITTKDGYQTVDLSSEHFPNEAEMFKAADEIRRQILRTGKVPSSLNQKINSSSPTRPKPSEINPPQKKEDGSWADVTLNEQQVKSKETKPSIFSKIKMWIFG